MEKKQNEQTKMKILVVGATGGVGKRVVKLLLARDYDVIALVRDAARGKKMLGDRVKLFEADLTIPQTLKPEMMSGVSAVICCSGTRVQPVEGDTPKREKYYQGIKFYLPEVVDSPEQVEYQGMKNLVNLVSQHIQPATDRVLSRMPKSQFILISSAGVTRPNRPGINLEEEPPAVRMNDQLGGILTWKLRGEEVVKASGLNYTIIRPCALTEKPGDKPLYAEQGDNLKGQVSREAIAQLSIQAVQLPEAVNKTFEVKEEDQPGNTNWKQLFAGLS